MGFLCFQLGVALNITIRHKHKKYLLPCTYRKEMKQHV